VGIRETLNGKPALAGVLAVALVLAAVGTIGWQLVGTRRGAFGQAPGQAFFTVDDGKTWFADDMKKVPPFEKDGKLAYRCFVWTCDGGKTTFVSHLQRYTADAKKSMEGAQAKGTVPDPATIKIIMAGVEVKAPRNGDVPKNWLKEQDPQASKFTQPSCKEGGTATPRPVTP
jgi:hypothetical protein